MRYWTIKSLVNGTIYEQTVQARLIDQAIDMAAAAYSRMVSRAARRKWLASRGAVRRFIAGIYVVVGERSKATSQFYADLETLEIQ